MFTNNVQLTLPCDAVTIHAGQPPMDINDLHFADHLWLHAVDGADVDEQGDITLRWDQPRSLVFWVTWYQGQIMYVGFDGMVIAHPGDTITIHLPLTATCA